MEDYTRFRVKWKEFVMDAQNISPAFWRAFCLPVMALAAPVLAYKLPEIIRAMALFFE